MIGAPFAIDTAILVYVHDAREARKQAIATELIRKGIEAGTARLPYQAVVEFVAVFLRGRRVRPSWTEPKRCAKQTIS
jgi:hypothetical protein